MKSGNSKVEFAPDEVQEVSSSQVRKGVNCFVGVSMLLKLLPCTAWSTTSTTGWLRNIKNRSRSKSIDNVGPNNDNIEEPPAPASTPGKMFTFSGHIVFALLDPIVENNSMLCHCSDQLISFVSVYSTNLDEKRTAGQAHRRKMDADSNRKHCRHSDNLYNVDNTSSRHK